MKIKSGVIHTPTTRVNSFDSKCRCYSNALTIVPEFTARVSSMPPVLVSSGTAPLSPTDTISTICQYVNGYGTLKAPFVIW